ncbi:MAG TPA: isoprenylcysteine carboxylmethyltransferase family protein [Rhizomicrobium sp.]|jgi:protein-S-isoprenylcysteine O-methyltransferase Ste14
MLKSMIRIPPPIWMFLFLALAGAASWLVRWKNHGELRIVWLGIALIVIGVVVSQSAFFLFRREDTEIMPHSETNKKLVIRGPYRVTRNPMYLGLVLISLGIALWVGTPPMYAVPVLVFIIANSVHIPFEEAKMRRQFGATYDDYTKKVRRWI